MDDMYYFRLWTQGFDAMNNSMLWLTWMTSGCELKALDSMNILGLWMT